MREVIHMRLCTNNHNKIRLIWKVRWSAGKALFLLNRYSGLIFSVFLLNCEDMLTLKSSAF